MSDTNIVFEFLKRTRISVESDDFKSCEEDIKKFYSLIVDACVQDSIDEEIPTLIIGETYNKYSQLLPIRFSNKQYKHFVLYDYHLEKLLKRFVTIVLADEDPGHDVWKLAYDLFSEEMLLNEEHLLFAYFRMNGIALGDYKIISKDDSNNQLIEKVQASYILAHEVGHWLYSMAMTGKEKQVLNLSDNVQNVMDNCKELLIEIYEDYKTRFNDREYNVLIEEQKRIVYEDTRIIEECFADAIAYSYIVSYINAEHKTVEARLMAVKALFIMMMSLQILSMSNLTFADESFENSVSIRLVFLRNYLSQYFEDISEEYLEVVETIVNRFEERVTNIILESFSELEDRADNIKEIIPDDDVISNVSVYDFIKLLTNTFQ